MQNRQESVRFYIDREVDAPVVRHVSVKRPETSTAPGSTDERERVQEIRDRAADAAASESIAQISKRSRARQRVRELVRTSLGRSVAMTADR